MGYRMRINAVAVALLGGLIGVLINLVGGSVMAAPDLSRWSPVAAKMYDLLAGEDQTLNQLWVSTAGTGCRITTATSTECKDPGGEVVGFYVASTTGGTVAFYNDNDGTCSSGQLTGTITPAIGWHALPLKFSTAICVLTANTIDVTVTYR